MGLKNIIDECQSAFVKGRNIHNHTRIILDLLDYSDSIKTNSYVLFLDFFKAFDTVEHPFLLRTLHFMGFGINFCNIVEMLYTDISSSVSLNPGITPRFYSVAWYSSGLPYFAKALYNGNTIANFTC